MKPKKDFTVVRIEKKTLEIIKELAFKNFRSVPAEIAWAFREYEKKKKRV